MITAQNALLLGAHLIFHVITKSLFNTAAAAKPRGPSVEKRGVAVCKADWQVSPLSPPGSDWLYHTVNHTKSSKPLAPADYLPTKTHTLAHFYDGWSWFVRRKKKTPPGHQKLIQHVITIRLLKEWSGSEVLERVKRLDKQENSSFPFKHAPANDLNF